MRRCVQNQLIVSATPAAAVEPSAQAVRSSEAPSNPDTAAPFSAPLNPFPIFFSYNSCLWKIPVASKSTFWVKKKRASYFHIVASMFSAANDDLKPLPAVDDFADSHIIRAAHLVSWGGGGGGGGGDGDGDCGGVGGVGGVGGDCGDDGGGDEGCPIMHSY